MELKSPGIKTWIKGNLSKKDDPVEILRASLLQTIDTYSDQWIMCTRTVQFSGVLAGYGVLIHGSSADISGACGEQASNYDAEIAAIEINLDYIKTFFHTFPSRNQSIVIFTESLSALQGLEIDPTDKDVFRLY